MSHKDIAVSGRNHFCDAEVITQCFLNLFKHKILLYTGYEDIKQVERRSDGDGNENGKRQQVQIGKTTTLHLHRAFLYISQPSQHDYDVKLPNFTRPLYKLGGHNTISFSFS